MDQHQLLGLLGLVGDSPLEKEYNPLQAGLIGAGYGATSISNNARAGYYRGRSNIADALGDAQARAHWRSAADAVDAQRADHDRLYKPLARAFPYATAFGEALPLVAGGLLTGGTAAAPVWVNLADRYALEVARASGYNPQGVMGPLRQVLTGTGLSDAVRALLSK